MWMLLGVIVNLSVVAWSMAFAGPIRPRAIFPAALRPWPAYAPNDWPAPTGAREWRGWTRGLIVYDHAVPGRTINIFRSEFGFPFRAMQIHRVRARPNGPERDQWLAAVGAYRGFDLHSLLPPRGRAPYYIPIVPVARGFVVNSVFYTALLWLLCRAGARLYQRLRIPEGHCRRCRYDLSGLDDGAPCPECGTLPPASSIVAPS